MPCTGDLSQATPTVIFDADTNLATSNHQRILKTKDFMAMPPPLVTYDGLAALL
jgi:hypothetical protein